MKKTIQKVAVVFFAVMVLAINSLTATAATTTETIELETRSALLIDRSGSMNGTAVGQYDLASFDAVVYFDHRLSTDSEFKGGGDSSICETLDELADAGFVHITVVTDGEQWPLGDYSGLGVYTDLDLTIHLVEEDEASKEFIDLLSSRLVKSNLKVVKPDGAEELILNNYKAPIYLIEVPAIEENESSNLIQNIKEGNFPWWLVLILAAIIAAIFDFIHELITRREGKENTLATKPIPEKAVAHIAQGAHVVADFSGSMAAQQSATATACMQVQKGNEAVLCFGDDVSERKAKALHRVQAAGKTAGWEALEEASSKGWKEIVLVSDLGFNGKMFDEKAFAKRFKKITVVIPEGYSSQTLEDLKKIADEVEVLPL